MTGEPPVVKLDEVLYTPATDDEPEGNPFTANASVTSFQNGTAFSGYVANSRIASLMSDRQNILLCVGLLIAADYFSIISHVSALTAVC